MNNLKQNAPSHFGRDFYLNKNVRLYSALLLKIIIIKTRKIMQIKISGETPFKCLKDQFSIGPTSSGYQIAFSVDRETWTLDPNAIVPAGENLLYLGSGIYLYYKLVGNTDTEVDAIL